MVAPGQVAAVAALAVAALAVVALDPAAGVLEPVVVVKAAALSALGLVRVRVQLSRSKCRPCHRRHHHRRTLPAPAASHRVSKLAVSARNPPSARAPGHTQSAFFVVDDVLLGQRASDRARSLF